MRRAALGVKLTMARSLLIARSLPLALVGLAGLPLGCLAPALRPAEMADVGQVVASVGGMFPDGQNSASGLEGSATAAVGLLPHLQLEAAGVLDQGDTQAPTAGVNWRLGGGLRGAVPLGTSHSEIQIAGLFDLGRSTDIFSTGGCLNHCSRTEFFDERRATVEAGWVHNFDRHRGAVGIFVDGFASFLEETAIAEVGNCGGTPFYRSDFAVGGLGYRFSLDLRPFDAMPWLGVLLGASAGGPTTGTPVGSQDLSELVWFDVGAGLLFVL